MLSLREAAEMAGVSKSSVFRAIKAGRLSASRSASGEFEIDPSELLRAYPPRRTGLDQLRQQLEQKETADRPEWDNLQTRNATLEAKVQGLEALLAEVRANRDTAQEHLRTTQDQLRQVLAALPAPAQQRRSWRLWRRSA